MFYKLTVCVICHLEVLEHWLDCSVVCIKVYADLLYSLLSSKSRGAVYMYWYGLVRVSRQNLLNH